MSPWLFTFLLVFSCWFLHFYLTIVCLICLRFCEFLCFFGRVLSCFLAWLIFTLACFTNGWYTKSWIHYWQSGTRGGRSLSALCAIDRFRCIIQIINATKIPGPPGYHGTQGLAGPPGPLGSGNETHCSYVKGSSSPVAPDAYAKSKVEIAEPNVG